MFIFSRPLRCLALGSRSALLSWPTRPLPRARPGQAGRVQARRAQQAPWPTGVPLPFSAQNNHHEENISSKMRGLNGKVSDLEKAAAQRKAKLDENSAFLQFNWKADVVESWIGERGLGAAPRFPRPHPHPPAQQDCSDPQPVGSLGGGFSSAEKQLVGCGRPGHPTPPGRPAAGVLPWGVGASAVPGTGAAHGFAKDKI